MTKKILDNKRGLTLIEILVAVAVIIVISSISITYIRSDDSDEVKLSAQQLAADVRLARNYAVSRISHDFGEGAIYPPGGYGLYFNDPVTAGQPSYYILFADSGDAEGYDDDDDIIKRVTLNDPSIELNDYSSNRVNFYFTFLSENQVNTNMAADEYNRYALRIVNLDQGEYPLHGYGAVMLLGEISGGGDYVWANAGISDIGEMIIEAPEPPPDDPEDINLFN